MFINYKILAESFLLEHSGFHGEFWIQDNYVQSADSNIDKGHEAIVIESAANQVLSEIGIYEDEPYLPDMDREIFEKVADKIPDEMREQYENGEIYAMDCLKYYGKHILNDGKFEELVDAAYDRIDVRRFAMREWGWKAIRGTVVDTWNLAPDDLKFISSGLQDAYDYDIEHYNNSSVDKNGYGGPYFDIEVYSRGDYYKSVPLELIGKDVSKILPYRTFIKGQRINETDELVDENKIIQNELDELSKKYKQYYLDVDVYACKNYIKLEALIVKKNAPVGTGSSYMRELCTIADKHKKIIVLRIAKRGYGGFDNYKKTTSRARLSSFYARFGFLRTNSKNNYRPDLSGDMFRLPIK